jgi:malate synthase
LPCNAVMTIDAGGAMTDIVSSVAAAHRSSAEVSTPLTTEDEEILSPGALAFVAELERRFGPEIEHLLELRMVRRKRLAAGDSLGFLAETRDVRENDWRVPTAPVDLTQRLVEITGPTDRKIIINALNSGADVFMADFEDATSPTWGNILRGQANLRDAVRGDISHDDAQTGKSYRLASKHATLMVRPRGLHLTERHLTVDGSRSHAALVDFGLFFFHNAAKLVKTGSGPYFYLPKLESHLEARLWNDVFIWAQDALCISHGTVRATVLIETLPAAFETHEILHELREHSAGLNCGRWDYIFSSIKARAHNPHAIYPDRAQVSMTQPNMRAFTRLVVGTCHRRGAHAIGGMSAFIPSGDEAINRRALAQVRADKEREAGEGLDGAWVAHPGLVSVAREAFASRIAGPNQLHTHRDETAPSANELLAVPSGTRTEAGLRTNVRVGIRYLEAWLRGLGAVPLYHIMEDAATAEISRAQVWQWTRWSARLDNGRRVTPQFVEQVIADEMQGIAREVGDARISAGRYAEARALFSECALSHDLEEFLTTIAYERLDG